MADWFEDEECVLTKSFVETKLGNILLHHIKRNYKRRLTGLNGEIVLRPFFRIFAGINHRT